MQHISTRYGQMFWDVTCRLNSKIPASENISTCIFFQVLCAFSSNTRLYAGGSVHKVGTSPLSSEISSKLTAAWIISWASFQGSEVQTAKERCPGTGGEVHSPSQGRGELLVLLSGKATGSEGTVLGRKESFWKSWRWAFHVSAAWACCAEHRNSYRWWGTIGWA